MKTVMVFGTFDVLHDGHFEFFQAAKAFGDRLIVVISRDSTVVHTKETSLLHSEDERKGAVEQLGIADLVVLGSTGDKYAVIERYHPDILCLGYDQRSFDKGLREMLDARDMGHVVIHRLPSYKKLTQKSKKKRPELLPSRIASLLKEQNVPLNASLILGVSGGADSTSLLLALSLLPDPWVLQLHVVHVNYGLRGKDSYDDEQFVQALAERVGATFSSTSPASPLSGEAEMRTFRHKYFQNELKQRDAHAILLAHTLEDQVETILLRLIRGTGLKGLSSMQVKSGSLLRPLLGVHRYELEAFLTAHHQDWREDKSNTNMMYLRNRVRRELLPLLEEYNPNITERLLAVAETARDDYAYLRHQAEIRFQLLLCEPARKHSVRFDYVGWLKLPPALKREVLRVAILKVRGTLESVSLVHLDEVCEMLTNRRTEGEKVFFGHLRIQERYDSITVTFDTEQ